MKTSVKYILPLLLLGILFTSCNIKDESNGIPSTVDRILMLSLVNNLRQTDCDCGKNSMPATHTLEWNSRLEAAAYVHALDMEKNQYFSHTSPDGSTPQDRIETQGYMYVTYGENIASSSSGREQAVFEMWKNSAGHCKNMMDIRFTEIGVACSGSYWVMVLAKPKQPADGS